MRSGFFEEGGSVSIMMDIVKERRAERKSKKESEEGKYRSGGAVNIIAKGVLHEDPNELGDRGIPIVTKKDKKKVAEVEKNEILFHKDVSAEIERLTQLHAENPDNPEILKELGALMQDEILYNTIDKQGEVIKK